MDDTISRQAAIDAIDEISREVDDGDGFDYAKWREYFCELPSAQFATDTNVGIKLGTNSAEVGTDCISRQAAIDEIDEWIKAFRENGHKESAADACLIQDGIIQLPSAEPKIVRCKDCKYAEYIDDVQTLWCTECGQGRTVAPNDFCSYAERREVTT